MAFNVIDLLTWKRKTHYEHYRSSVRCTYSVVVNIEVDRLVTELKTLGLKPYPAQIYMLAAVVNAFREFRMDMDREGRLGYWDVSHPAYAIFNRETETFSSICTPFNPDFSKFYADCCKDIETFEKAEVLFPQSDTPENTFSISSVPWLDFTGFNLNVYGEGAYLPPIFTIGRYLEQGGKKQLPLAIQAHHAVCDGYHVGRFVVELRDMAANCKNWL